MLTRFVCIVRSREGVSVLQVTILFLLAVIAQSVALISYSSADIIENVTTGSSEQLFIMTKLWITFPNSAILK